MVAGDVEDNKNTSSGSDEGWTLNLNALKLDIAKNQLPYFFMLVASIILLICSVGSVKNEAYAISVAVIAMIGSLCALAMTYKMEETWKRVGPFIGYFLLLWNTIGAFILTFSGPFPVTGNGYFASWAICVFALMAVGYSLKETAEGALKALSSPLVGLVVASIVVLVACIFDEMGKWQNILSLIISILTIAVCGVFVYMDHVGSVTGKEARSPVLSIFSILWVVIVATQTFGNGRFKSTGNGYFGAWAGLICCIYAISFSS